ncbi:MAG TPA: PAS domain S-box protein [Chloroflexota bacterium]|nr:PAS domain S-box protein [Chloroflexota bacterium]
MRTTDMHHDSPPSGRDRGRRATRRPTPFRRKDQRTEQSFLDQILALQQSLAEAGSDIGTISAAVAHHAGALTGADGAAVEQRVGAELMLMGAVGDLDIPGDQHQHTMESFSGLSLRLGTPLRCDDTRMDPRIRQERARVLGTRSALVTPLRLPGNTDGVLLVTSRRPNAFGARDEDALRMLCGFFGAAIEHAAAYASEALIKQENLYRALSRNASDLVSIIDSAGIIQYASPSHQAVLGYRAEELLGAKARELMHPDDLDRVQRASSGRLGGAEAVISYEARLRHADGSWRLLEITVIYPGKNGVVEGLIVNAHDISERAAAEAALHAREEQLRTLIAQLPVILFAVDANGVYTLSEGRGLAAIGRVPGEIVGQSIDEVWADSAEAVDSIWRTLAGEPTTTRVTSGAVTLESRLTPVRDAEGRITGLIGVAVDITEQVRANQFLQTSEQSFRSLVDHAPVGICIVGATGLVEAINPAFRSLLGAEDEDMLGQALEKCFPSISSLPPIDEPAERAEVEVRALDGRAHTCVITVAPISGTGGEAKRAVFLIDVTEQARARRQSEQARAAAEQLAQLRSDFVAAVSHELRTPLTAIVGYAELLQAHWNTIDDARRLEQINRIVLSANRQQQLVEDLLLLSRAEAEAPIHQMEAVNLTRVMERAAMEVRGAYGEQQIVLDGPETIRVLVEQSQAVQILVNLLDNAAKYSSEGSPITVSWREEFPLASVLVRDHGPGIPERGRAQLFTRFGRIPGSRIRSGRVGTGLGLYIARRLAEAMGGSLDLAETGPEGSTFQLYLPIAGGCET